MQIKVGDRVTTKRSPGRWGKVTKVTNPDDPVLTKVDITYRDGSTETGVPIGSIDEHKP